MSNEKLNPRDVFGEILLEIGRQDKSVMAVSCDSGSGMDAFKNELPEQYLEVGISEQDAIGICAGLSEGGQIPVVSAIAPFISMRCYEQICHFEIGKGELLLDAGDDIVLVVTGTLSVDALKAGQVLAKKGFAVKVLNLTTVKPLDKKLLISTYKHCKMMCTIEEHITTGGFGSSVSELLADHVGGPIRIMGIKEGATQTEPYRELLEDYGLTAEKLAKRIETCIINLQ